MAARPFPNDYMMIVLRAMHAVVMYVHALCLRGALCVLLDVHAVKLTPLWDTGRYGRCASEDTIWCRRAIAALEDN